MPKLDFGILLMPSSPRGESFERRVQECIEQAVAAEEAGFESCWVPEHHQDMGFVPQSLLVAAAVASRTSTIRIGTNIALIGLKHPMQVVEEFHSLDVISGGRVVAGVGLGYQAQDFSMFGRDVKDRVSLYEDALTVLNLARDNEVISFEGRHCSLTDVRVVPRPVQTDGPRILMGTSSRAGARRVGRLGDGLLLGAIDGLDGLRTIVDEYTPHAHANGRSRTVTLNRWAAVGDSDAAARDVLEPHAMKALRYYFRHGSTLSAMLPERAQAAWAAAEKPADLSFEDFEQLFLWGDPDTCVERLELFREGLDLDRVVLQIRSGGGPSHEDTIDQIRRFGTSVIPHYS
ncbi:LLM class flavin-dependent oxidoreductase [Streptomyces sp. NPDC056296]|uniref:LLM class flavin-dependent oxidoreductase n=1 Tax=Streptomyces sp. NPDC056296 TaxID=3345775 RepID=UPI0035D6E574